MKKIWILLLAMGMAATSQAQLKATPKCGNFVVDILNGNLNQIKPDFSMAEIKDKLPCFTGSEEEGGSPKCGGAVFYKDKDVSFYTQRNYIEIGDKFKGQLSIPLMGASRASLFKWLGNPKLKDETWDAFEMAYGTIVLHYNAAGKVKLIQMSTKSSDALSLCE